jgi:hypothetical protein
MIATKLVFGKNGTLTLVLLMALLAASAPAQNQAPANAGPLAATMQFIQDKLHSQAPVAFEIHDQYGTTHASYRITGAIADTASCVLRVNTAAEYKFPAGGELRDVRTTTIALKNVENVAEESGQDIFNRQKQDASTHSPEYYAVTLTASKPVFKDQYTATTVRDGKEFPATAEDTGKIQSTLFADEDTAEGVAKALTLATKLCGGSLYK